MRIALAQINPLVGDLLGNGEQLLQACRLAAEQGADLVVAPELALWGYPPRDLLLRPALRQRQAQALDQLAAHDPRPEQALRASGAGTRRALLQAAFPAVARTYLAYGAYRGDVILRETVVVGLVGAGGLGVVLLEALSSFAWGEVLPVLVVYAGLTLAGETLADACRRRLLLARTVG